MTTSNRNGPVIIIRRHRQVSEPHHGGAWKIAYADFVTAMMAFFLLLWLLASTTEKQRVGISDFFNAIATTNGGSVSILQGKVLDTAGNKTATTPQGADPAVLMPAPGMGRPAPESTITGNDSGGAPSPTPRQTDDAETSAFDKVEANLRTAIRESPELSSNLMVERTPEGLRIQLVDQERSPMFASGSAALAPRMEQLLRLVASIVARVPNPIALGGHTDAHPLARGDYTNWELSADRANAARRALIASGVPEKRIVRVLGLADRQPLVKDDPVAATNRRISVLLISTEATGAPP